MPQANRDKETYIKLTTHYDTTGEFYFLRRGQPIDVMRYLPKFLREEPEFLKVQDALSWEHAKLKAKAMDIVRQFFIETATWGLNSWERIFEVTPPAGADYELRRSLVKTKMAGWAVMTKERSEWLLNQFVAEKDGYIIELPRPGVLNIVIPSTTDYFKAMWNAMDEMLPYHFALWYTYTIYGELEDDEKANIIDDGAGDFLADIFLNYSDTYPYGVNNLNVNYRGDGSIHFGFLCRSGLWLHNGFVRHDGLTPGAVKHGGVEDLAHDRLEISLGLSHKDSYSVKGEHFGYGIGLELTDQAETKDCSGEITLGVALRHNGSIFHDGAMPRGKRYFADSLSGDLGLKRICRNGLWQRGDETICRGQTVLVA